MKNLTLSAMNRDECEKVFETALEVLAEVGCDVHHEQARKILQDAGADVEGIRVKIPGDIVRKALETAPSTIDIYDQNGNHAMTLDPHHGGQYCVAGVLNLNRLDYETGERHLTTTKDAYEAGLVINKLPNINVATGMCYAVDCDPTVSDIYEVRELLKTTDKPLLLWNFDTDGTKTELEMCAAVAGGMDKLLEKPFIIAGAPCSPPLAHAEDVLDRLLYMFEMGVPTPYVSSPMIGASAPSSMAGGMVICIADMLVGLVLSQLINEGCPFIGTGFIDYIDMKTMNFTQTSPEVILGALAVGDMYRYLNLPFQVHLGCTDSPILDQQAAADISAQIFAALLSGANLYYFSGYLETAMSSSLETLVLSNECIDMLRFVKNGFDVTEESLAKDTIARVGPSGNFLGEEHTFRHFRDFWAPTDFIRQDMDHWKADGAKDFGARAHEKVKTILDAGIEHPLGSEVEKALDQMIRASEIRRGITKE